MKDKDLVFITCCPNELYYIWQTNIWLESASKFGYLNKCQVLIYKANSIKSFKELDHPSWKILQDIYPQAQFFFYNDKGMRNVLKVYEPVNRPHMLIQHWEKFPELSTKAIFYHDCDIMLSSPLQIDNYINDDINYVSWTGTMDRSDNYLWSKYFDKKREDVLPIMLKEYDKRDILGELATICGIERQIILDNDNNTGGAQYLFKNIDKDFWERVQSDALMIRIHLMSFNKLFFSSEDKGIQSWCADMWAVFYGLLRLNKTVKVIPELDFTWATDTKDKLKNSSILHNAGVTSDSTIRAIEKDEKGERTMVDAPAFFKGRYDKHHGNPTLTPFRDPEYTSKVLNHPISSNYCFHTYLEELKLIQTKYNLSY